MRYWIIEHPVRGDLQDWEVQDADIKPRFKWTGLRTDSSNHAFYSVEEMRRLARKIPERVRSRCYGLEIANQRVREEHIPLS